MLIIFIFNKALNINANLRQAAGSQRQGTDHIQLLINAGIHMSARWYCYRNLHETEVDSVEPFGIQSDI